MMIPADCEKCGECCRSNSATFVPLSHADQRRLGPMGGSLTELHEGQLYMRMKEGACSALVVSQGMARCSIYERRPELCREFQQGSPECRSVLRDIRRRQSA